MGTMRRRMRTRMPRARQPRFRRLRPRPRSPRRRRPRRPLQRQPRPRPPLPPRPKVRSRWDDAYAHCTVVVFVCPVSEVRNSCLYPPLLSNVRARPQRRSRRRRSRVTSSSSLRCGRTRGSRRQCSPRHAGACAWRVHLCVYVSDSCACLLFCLCACVRWCVGVYMCVYGPVE